MHNSELILVADDDLHLLKVVSRDLQDAGYASVTVADGHAALAVLREKEFSVALIDLEIPRLDGFGVPAGIQSDGQTGQTGDSHEWHLFNRQV